MSITDLLKEFGRPPYTREQCAADLQRITARICEKHGIQPSQVVDLIREHRYEHDDEDIEDEWIKIRPFVEHLGLESNVIEETPAATVWLCQETSGSLADSIGADSIGAVKGER